MVITTDYVSLVPIIAYRCHVEPLPSFGRDDQVSVGYVALCEAAHSYDPTLGASFKTYLWSKVRWAILTAWRQQFPLSHDRYDPEDKIRFCAIEDIIDSPAEVRFCGPEKEYLDDVLAILTPRERLVIYQKYWLGWTGTAIARRLGVDQSGVNVSLRLALGKLRKALEESTR